MKSKTTILLIIIFFMSFVHLTNAQVNVTLNIENQTVSGTDFLFDIYLTAPNDFLYLGNADFVLTFNSANFASPVLSKEGSSPGFCTFVPTDASGNNPLFTQSNYFDNTATAVITGNELIINLNGPTPSDQTAFDTRVAKIDNQTSTHRLGRFKVSGITNTSGTMGLQWKTSGGGVITQVFTLAPTTPWNSSPVNSINAVNPSDTPLPVELTTFSVTSKKGSAVDLKWETATEVNNYGFEVERSVVKGQKSNSKNQVNEEERSWKKIGFIEGAGNSNAPKKYSFVDKNLVGGSHFEYRLKQVDVDGSFEYSKIVEIEVLPVKYELNQNYPNPFNPTTTIKFSLPQAGKVRLDVYNLLGELVTTLVNKNFDAGFQSVQFNASNLASGIYIYRLSSNSFSQVRKMMLLK